VQRVQPHRMWYWRFVLISLSTLQLTKCFYVAECLPEWVTKSREENRYMKLSEIPCPNGTRLPGGITFNSEFYREYPVTHTTTVVLSYVPWFVLFWACVEFIIIRGTRQLLFLGFSVSTINFNTFFLKLIIHDPRPKGSCSLNCGMPSTTSTMAIGYLTLVFLDLSTRINPIDPRVLQRTTPGDHSMLGALGYFLWGDWISFIPISNTGSTSNAQFVSMSVFWFSLLGYVPASRVFLYDNSVRQVFVGSVLGVIEGVLWFVMMRKLAWKFRHQLGRHWPRTWQAPLLQHNLRPPRHEILKEEIGGCLIRAREVVDREMMHNIQPGIEMISNREVSAPQTAVHANGVY